ncbi:MAG: hypothetical protein U0K93_05590 [Acutalibacteraceae bacterium]|nr:hypothetical protein [Acutalibacteraceae bacterium]
MRRGELLNLNRELYEKAEKYKAMYEDLKAENAKLSEKVKLLWNDNKALSEKQNATAPLKELEKKVINQAKFTDEEKYGASSIGKIVIKATACCNKLTSANDGYDPKELVNLILGRTEVAKAEILRIVNSDLEAERKSELIDDCKKSAEDYFESVMAQKE